MGGFSWLARQPAAAGDPTHALFAAQSHSIVDNLVALFEYSRAWNCSSDILGCLRRDQDAGPGSLTRRRQLSMHFCRVVAKSPRSPRRACPTPDGRYQQPETGVSAVGDASPAPSRLVGPGPPPIALATQSVSGTPALRKPAKYVLSTKSWICGTPHDSTVRNWAMLE